MILAKGSGWDYGRCVMVRLPCGHWGQVPAQWIDAQGRVGRVSCMSDDCRSTVDELVLEGWTS